MAARDTLITKENENMSRVICAGSINMDIVAGSDKHPSVGETVPGSTLDYFPGGKGANQAVAAARLGASTMMLGKVGDDASGSQLVEFLTNQGVDTNHIAVEPNCPTGTAIIVVAQSDNTIVVIPGANGRVNGSDVAITMNENDVLISQFEIPIATVTDFFRVGRNAGAKTVLNPAPAHKIPKELLDLCDVIILNETELAFIAGIERVDLKNAASCAKSIRAAADQVIIVTLGAAGAVAVAGDREVHVEGRNVPAVDTTGAGDCFVGALAASLAHGNSVDESVERANIAASISVQRAGAAPSMPTMEELDSGEFN